jgi:methyl-accepting chemotaxis protein
MFKNQSLKRKVFISLAATIFLVCIACFNIFKNINEMMTSQKWVTHTDEVIVQFNEVIEYMIDMETGQRGFLMSGDKSFLEPYNNAIKKIEKHITDLQKKVSDNSVQVKRLNNILSLKKQWIAIANEVEMNARESYDRKNISQEKFEAILKSAKGKTIMDKLRKEVSDGIQMEEKLNVKRKSKASKLAKRSILWIEIAMPISIVIGFTLLITVLNKLIKDVEQVLLDLDKSKVKLNNISQEVLNSSQTLAEGTNEQASSLQQTSSSMEEIKSMISRSSENAAEAGKKSTESKDITQNGRNIVSNMIQSINEIDQSNNKLSQQVKSSNDDLTKIIDVISAIEDNTKVINDIVFQTKLLSFNASVEAARAGEHGKGFAVVAEEVGNLATMSGNAASKISEMLESSINDVKSIVNTTKSSVDKLVDESSSKVSKGIEIAKRCEDSLQSILENITETNNLTNEISLASKEQSQGVAEVTEAVQRLNGLTGRTTTISNSTANVSKDLQVEVNSLNEVLDSLEVSIKGSAA